MANGSNDAWEKSSKELATFFADLMPDASGLIHKQMFGWPCFFVNGNLFAGLHKQSMIFRLSDDDRAAFLRLEDAADFEPMPGRKMKGYVALGNPMRLETRQLQEWVNRALKHTRSLPAKTKGKSKTLRK